MKYQIVAHVVTLFPGLFLPWTLGKQKVPGIQEWDIELYFPGSGVDWPSREYTPCA
jgi:hypothetical protein